MANNDKQLSYLARSRQFMKFRIIHIDDSPHRIALGVALGTFTAFLPCVGLHTLIALLLALIARANKAVAVLCSWISNPFTIIPIFVPCYLLGRAVVGIFRNSSPVETAEATEVLKQIFTSAITTSEFWRETVSLFGKIGLELITGCIICSVIFGISSYFIIYKMIVVHRIKHERKIAAKKAKAQAKREAL